MTFVLVLIRNNIRHELNAAILCKIISALEAKEIFEDNQIRKAIATIEDLDREQWYCMYHNNVYVKHEYLKNESAYSLLIQLCDELKRLILNRDFDKAYDLADAFHCLPDIIADNDFEIPKSFFKTYINPYMKKWDIKK